MTTLQWVKLGLLADSQCPVLSQHLSAAEQGEKQDEKAYGEIACQLL